MSYLHASEMGYPVDTRMPEGCRVSYLHASEMDIRVTTCMGYRPVARYREWLFGAGSPPMSPP